MLDKTNDLATHFADLRAFREKLKKLVETITEELDRRDRMNDAKVEMACVQVDLAIREFTVFLTRLNADRVALEDGAENHAELMQLRREWGVLSAQSSLFRVELNQWISMRPLVQAQRMNRRKRFPLYERKTPDLFDSQHKASDDIFNLIHAILNPVRQSEEADKHGCFPDISLPNSQFHQHLHAAFRVLLAQGRTPPMQFLDVGCGGGLKVISALRYFTEAHGLDFQHSYVDAADQLIERAGYATARAFQADALTFDNYADYDVIYFYRPIRDEQKLIEMEKRIAATARPGTVLIAPYSTFSNRYAAVDCGHVAGKVYLAKTSQKEADAVRRSAEKIGPCIMRASESRVDTIWTPLLRASRNKGYDLAEHVPPV